MQFSWLLRMPSTLYETTRHVLIESKFEEWTYCCGTLRQESGGKSISIDIDAASAVVK